MRPVLALCLLAALPACPHPGGSGPLGGGECFVDQECDDGELCSRDELCWPADQIRRVKTMWTVRGEPASAATCSSHPDLYIRFDGNVPDDLRFSPVPCAAGQFVVDKLADSFTFVELGIPNRGFAKRARFDAAGEATIDLVFF